MEYLVLLLALAVSAVFSGSETGFYALNHLKLRHEARSHRPAALLERTVRSPAGFLCALLVANNIANDAAVHAARSLLAEAGLVRLELWTPLLLTPVVFLFAEVGPKQFMLADPLRRTVAVAPVLAAARLLLLPVTVPLVAVTRLLQGGDETALARHQLTAFLLEGRHGARRHREVLTAARRVIESRGRSLEPFLHREVPRLPAGAGFDAARAALADSRDGLILLERPGRAPALLTGEALLRGGPGSDPESMAEELPVLPAGADIARAFGSLRRQGAVRALVDAPGTPAGLFDLEEALGLLLAPETSSAPASHG